MADLLDIVDGYLAKMGLEPGECAHRDYPLCRFLRRGSATMMIMANETPDAVRTLWFAARIMEIPEKGREEFFQRLLELNLDVPHGAFALDTRDGWVVLTDNIQADHIDFDEFYATCTNVIEVADEYDDRLKEEFGES